MAITAKRIPLVLKYFGESASEGAYTKIITEDNKHEYEELLHYLQSDEIPLIVCRLNTGDWTLLTTHRVLSMNSEGLRIMNHAELTYCDVDRKWEIANRARSLADFSKIVLRDVNNKTFTLTIEKGYPMGGFLNALSFIQGLFPKEK
ncbi:hypothetical protein [Mucilaginibacter sp. OK098]|uniref:hypothetical protein n=1 Tax=Mucilaginibacter sp. OK098 TaxID=1855297 RepID=UPI00091CC29A|nr:hypothetical protein [Mucilaginibacter sp. OK098]SHL98315.1 hypothetical protein SAMN05216524_101411 [Mucilaginibacter sp. OK098]